MKAEPSEPTLVLLRLSGEVSTKARATRRVFVTRLVQNLKDALASEGLRGDVERHYERLFVRLEPEVDPSLLERVFGIQSLSVVRRQPGEKLEEVVEAGEHLFRPAVAGRRFAVRARMVGTSRAERRFSGREVEVALGERLRPHSAGVDLGAPEVTAHVEIFEGHAYLFTERRPGPGGLPVGTESRAVALVSGGFDSPVAAWQILRRGVHLDYVFCNLGGATHRLGALRVLKVVSDRWSYGTRPRLHALEFEPVARELRERIEPRYWQVILKRLMVRAAAAVAREARAQALVTGESIGQVSSQTLQNLAVISDVTRLPILRPLVGANKDEIIECARRIGTAPLSAVVDEYCAMVPRRPATSARLDAVLHQEARLDPRILRNAIESREVLDVRGLDPDDSGLPELEISEVPTDAAVLDLRTRGEYQGWHWPGALHLDFGRAVAAYRSFARDRTYVLYCEFGLKSAHLAERMRREGLRAFHFRGGTRALRRLAQRGAREHG